LGVLRSTSVVGDIGEWLASAYYGAPREPHSNPGFDLRVSVGSEEAKLIEVKTLRQNAEDSYRRGSMGQITDGFTHLFAIRLLPSFLPEVAFEIPRDVIATHCPSGRMNLSRAIEKAADAVSGEAL